MKVQIDEALRYLGAGRGAPQELRRQAEEIAAELEQNCRPRYLYKVFPLTKTEHGFLPEGTTLHLEGKTASTMLEECSGIVLLACTLGSGFDTRLRLEQARDISRAVIMDACGSSLVESGCDAAEEEIRSRLPERFLTDRFSPGYGDLPLELQPLFCALLDTGRKLGLSVTDSCLLNPGKSVTALIGLADTPQRARVRGCAYCSMKDHCELRRKGTTCGI